MFGLAQNTFTLTILIPALSRDKDSLVNIAAAVGATGALAPAMQLRRY